MAEKIELKVDKREVLGKKVRFLRNNGVVPVHLFGHNVESQSLQGSEATLHKVISHAGHYAVFEHHEAAGKIIRGFLDRLKTW